MKEFGEVEKVIYKMWLYMLKERINVLNCSRKMEGVDLKCGFGGF